jgi:hypothetical protein
MGRLAQDKLQEAHGIAPVAEHGPGVAELHLGQGHNGLHKAGISLEHRGQVLL